jgi:predicted PurR-regulated permease PerM
MNSNDRSNPMIYPMNLAQWFGLLIIVVFAVVLWQLRQLLLLVFTAVILATALNKAVQHLQKFNLPRGVAVAITTGLTVVILAGFSWLIVPPLVEQFPRLMDYVPTGLAELRADFDRFASLIPGLPLPGINIQNINLIEDLGKNLQPLTTELVRQVFGFFSNSLEIVLSILLVLLLTLMLLIEPLKYRQGFISLFPDFYRERMDEILSRCEIGLGGWLISVFAKVAFVSILSAIALSVLQVPLPIANALLAGVLGLIPQVGSVLSFIPPMAIALLDSPWKAIAVFVLYFLIQQLEGSVLIPLVMQEQAALLPAVTLVSQVAFTLFFGFLGLLLSLPLLVVAQICIQEMLIKDVLESHPKIATHRIFVLRPRLCPHREQRSHLIPTKIKRARVETQIIPRVG